MSPRDVTDEGAGSILRAVGSLLVALSGGEQAQVERTLSEVQAHQPGPDSQQQPDHEASRPSTRTTAGRYPQPQGRPAATPPPTRVRIETSRPEDRPSGLLDDVEFVLADARDRAQAIIDESTERARELIRQERGASVGATGVDTRAFDDLRRGLRGLVTEVRDIQQRLARIESLLHEQNERAAATGATSSSLAPSPIAPMPTDDDHGYDEPRAVETEPAAAWRTPKPGDDQSGAEPRGERGPDEGYAGHQAPDADAGLDAPGYEALAVPPPAPVPPRSPFSVVPPHRREWGTPEDDIDVGGNADTPKDGEEAQARAAYEPPPPPPRAHYGSAEPAAEVAPEPGSWADEEYAQYETPAHVGATASGSPLVTFRPSDGAITLRVAPVAGFQGLMRIQDALTRLPVVHHASVEAYSQGEARLRIELADTADSDELVEALARTLRGPARVEDASEVNRELLITLR